VLTRKAEPAEQNVKLHGVHFKMSCTANMRCAARNELVGLNSLRSMRKVAHGHRSICRLETRPNVRCTAVSRRPVDAQISWACSTRDNSIGTLRGICRPRVRPKAKRKRYRATIKTVRDDVKPFCNPPKFFCIRGIYSRTAVAALFIVRATVTDRNAAPPVPILSSSRAVRRRGANRESLVRASCPSRFIDFDSDASKGAKRAECEFTSFL